MGKLDDELTDWDYPWLITLDEAILLSIKHLREARDCSTELSLGLHLKMSARALAHALRVYGMRLDEEKTE